MRCDSCERTMHEWTEEQPLCSGCQKIVDRFGTLGSRLLREMATKAEQAGDRWCGPRPERLRAVADHLDRVEEADP